jgi:exopolyphosphatase/guanosine-5'-triphosphate,3'-diphosphate pyrophosphatase
LAETDQAGAGEGARGPAPASQGARWGWPRGRAPTYAALDLGTNNCRLLVARPVLDDPARNGQSGASHGAFRIVDSFSRIVRLGEGLSQTGRLNEAAIERSIDALEVCRDKMINRGVTRARLIATEACRAAENGDEFIARVRQRTGLDIEIVDRETEAHLAAAGCASLADSDAEGVVLFDIGGGSSEVVWLGRDPRGGNGQARHKPHDVRQRVRVWASLQLGVVSLAEKFGGLNVTTETFEAMANHVAGELSHFAERAGVQQKCRRFHLLGTSGTVTTLAGVHLGLPRYDRRRVDGLWMSDEEVSTAMERLRAMTYEDRVNNGCIGPERADLVLAGCAILEAIRRAFPSPRIRIADRGLREGILLQLMHADRAWAQGRGRRW